MIRTLYYTILKFIIEARQRDKHTQRPFHPVDDNAPYDTMATARQMVTLKTQQVQAGVLHEDDTKKSTWQVTI